MKMIVNEIISLIKSQLTENTVNLVKLENFESPLIYMSVCSFFAKQENLTLIGNIETNKYNSFVNAANAKWDFALDYLRTNGFVNENVPLTKLRNDSVANSNGTTLLLLMGAEAAVDKGSIKDFESISMVNIVEIIKKDYSRWFRGYLSSIDADTKDNRDIINNIYKAIFLYNNVDAMKLSDFADSLYDRSPEDISEITEYIFSTLNLWWEMPSIQTSVPKPARMKGNKAIKIIVSAYEFINNKLNISSAKFKALPKKLEQYAEKNDDIETDRSFMGFDSFNEFGTALCDFLNNRRIDECRTIFMAQDFGVINTILELKATVEPGAEPKPEKDSVIKLSGDPLDVYLQMITCSCIKFRDKFGGAMPQNLELTVKQVKLSNSAAIGDNDNDDNVSSVMLHYMNICSYMGGLVNFINEKGLSEKQITLKYVDDVDPFNQNNTAYMEGKISAIKKWGVDSEMSFTMTAVGNDETEKKAYDFKWSFSPYSSWKNAFSLLSNIYNHDLSAKTLPFLICCKNMSDFLGCESENEFYVKFESMPYSVMSKDYVLNIKKAFSQSAILGKFDLVNVSFEKWCDGLLDSGFFNNIGNMNSMIAEYIELLECAKNSYQSFSANQIEKISLLLNCFSIISNDCFLNDNRITEVILPSYNPAMLEKVNAQNFYTIFSFSELFNNLDSVNEKNYQQKLADIKKLAEITQGVDLIPNGSGNSIVCRNVWGYYAVYYGDGTQIPYISNIELVQDDVTEDESSKNVSESSQAKIIARNVADYLKTFPVRADGLNVCFIAPQEIQYVVSGIGIAAEELSKNGIEAVFNVRIICFGGTKNVSGYLRFWLNNYMSKERSVKINAYLKYIQSSSVVTDLPKMLENQDICFIYDILKTDTFKFEPYSVSSEDEQEQMQSCQFPMTFIPDTITGTHGRKRKVNISQMQFLVSKAYTQLAHRVLEPNSIEGEYKVMQQLSLETAQKDILDIVHQNCRWVVCEDKAIDRDLLQTDDKKIIGFSTGEGCFGEYNVTVSAKKTILKDIQHLLKIRLVEKFSAWNNDMAEKAADNCLALTESFDGSRILKALNPYDYEIHNFLAYALMVQELNMCESIDGKYISRNLLNMDSYQHWLKDAEENNRPDFILIEIPFDNDTFNVDVPLKIRIKVIECKMGLHVDNYIDKAVIQVNSGISALSKLWSKDNKSVSRRYWFTQLYRAIAFSRLGINDSDERFAAINAKIYGILNGNFEIEWSGDVYAYSLTDNNDYSEISDLEGNDTISAITLHKAGQLYVQKKLLPVELQDTELTYSVISEDNYEPNTNEDNSEEIVQTEFDFGTKVVPLKNQLATLPKLKEILVPFIGFLSSGKDCSRVDALNWFKGYYEISGDALTQKYKSNGHTKWETVLDFGITFFRKNGILINSSYGVFHITDFGMKVYNYITSLQIKVIDESLLKKIQELQTESTESLNTNSIARDEPKKPIDDYQNTTNNVHKSISEVRILLGEEMRTKEKYYWEFGNKNLNNRHLLINGNSGCGKTYCIQGLLMSAAMQGISSVVFDYTGGFTEDKLDPVFLNQMGDRIKQRVVYIEGIPINPFKKGTVRVGSKDYPEKDVSVASRIAEIFTNVYKFGAQQNSAVYSAVVNGLSKNGEHMTFRDMADELEEAKADTVVSKIRPFIDLDPFVQGEDFGWEHIRDDKDGIVYVIQLDGYDRGVQVLLTELLLWDIWNFSVKTGDESKPFILVMDEAQNLSHGEKSPSAKILTEGRKFGISGWYATQFMKPQLSDDEIQRLQQAGQKLYFCPPDDGVMAVAKNIASNNQDSKDWAERLKKLKKGECVTCGNMIKNDRWVKYEPKVLKVVSLQERLENE